MEVVRARRIVSVALVVNILMIEVEKSRERTDVIVIKRRIWKRRLHVLVIWYSKRSAREILTYLSSGLSISISTLAGGV